MELTESIIRNLQAKGYQYDVYDEVERSLVVRVNASGSKTYTARYLRGKRKSVGKFGEIPLSLARKKVRELSVAADNGQLVKGTDKLTSTKEVTVQQFLDEHYLPYLEANHEDGIKTYKRIVARFSKDFGSYKLSAVPPFEVEKWKNNRIKIISKRTKKPITKSTVNRDLGAFKSVFESAVEWKIIAANPISDVAVFELSEDAVVRFLDSREEQPAFYATLDKLPVDMFRVKVTLGVRTGARKSEIKKLKLNRVDLREKNPGIFITGKTAKSKKNRFIPLGKLAYDTLYKYLRKKFPTADLDNTYYSTKPEHDVYIFTDDEGELVGGHRRQWESFLKTAGITRFRYHDMRHEFASKFIMKTGDLYTLSKLLGHSTTQVTERVYAHLADEHIADKVRMLD